MENPVRLVVNKCYGGYSLSLPAVVEYLKECGKSETFIYIVISDYKCEKYKKCNSIDEVPKRRLRSFSFIITEVDLGEIVSEDDMYDKVDCSLRWRCHDEKIKRHDPRLVRVVERLGEKSWGPCAELAIEEYSGLEAYKILDHDGFEKIEPYFVDSGIITVDKNLLNL